MTNSQSRVLDVLEVKKRALERMKSPKRRMLEMFSSACLHARLTQEGIITTTSNGPLATSPHEKSGTPRGGRKRLAIENRRFYMIGCLVDRVLPRIESAFGVLKDLKITNGNWDLNRLRSELTKHQLTPKEVDAVLQARTPMGAAKRFVAKNLTRHAHPNGINLKTVNSCYSRYLKAVESKREHP